MDGIHIFFQLALLVFVEPVGLDLFQRLMCHLSSLAAAGTHTSPAGFLSVLQDRQKGLTPH